MKLCTVCGVVSSRAGSRCTEHARQSNRSRHNAVYSTRGWQQLSARMLRAWRGGLLECVCGLRIRNDGTFGDGRHRKLQVNPCEGWGRKARIADAIWEGPVLAQVAGIKVDDDTIASVIAVLGSATRAVEMDRARIDRRIRELALEHAAGGLGDDAYLARLKALRDGRDAIAEGSETGVPAQRAIEWLRALAESIQEADVPKEWADLVHAIYDRITVAGPEIVGVRLTQAAYAHGLALALPTKVALARPTGVGREIATYEIPIEGRDEWVAAARRLA